ncbi:hypothetical protein BC629DRAFT_292584 [Irpex lacteus]|nr:hypothetical protein BC629DRAFT_292584 [Irpex lacteus]
MTTSDMETNANTDKGWTPVDDGTDVRIQSALTKKYIDYAFHLDYAASQHASSGSRKLHQWEISGDTPNQVVRWKLDSTEPDSAGYLIRHAETGLCLIPTTVDNDGRVYLDVGPFGHGFTFKKTNDDSVIICLAGKGYTVTVEDASPHNGARLVLWPHASGPASRWHFRIDKEGTQAK